mgnify:CR=1 FL=1|tara:strand:+ start:251 stop:1921 length:1671 start_codon:yes stop_codon:yes gene_type:complete
MSRLIFDADTLGGTTTLSSADAVGNFTLTVPAVNGTLSVKDSSDDATFRNITLTGAVLAGAWNGSTITVPYGGTGATTLTGYVKGNGTSAMAGVATIPNTDITGLGTMSTQGSDAVTITGGTANGLTIGASNPAAATFTTLRFNSTLSVAGTTGLAGQVLTSNGASAPTWQSVAGVGTVTSVDGSGGTTGLTLTGGPITASGTLTLGGTLAVANGGTGATTASAARTALGLGTIATQAASSVAITGGAIDGTTVGSTTVAAGSFSTLNSSGATRLGGLSGNQSLQVNNVASGVNYVQITGGATGGGTVISSQGTDTNIPIDYRVKAGGYHAFTTDSGNAGQFLITHTASAVNQARITGSPTGSAVTLSMQGSDTNIAFAITTKNAGGIQFRSGNGLQAFVSDTASAVNYLNLTGAATGANPTFSTQGTDTNIGLTLTPKGTGAVQVTGTGFSPNVNLTDAATIAWDTTTAGGQTATFTFVSSNRTMGAPTNLKNGAFYALAVIQNAGSNTLTWNSVFKWAAGTAPTLSTAAGAKDYFTFRSDGTNLYQQGISQAVA